MIDGLFDNSRILQIHGIPQVIEKFDIMIVYKVLGHDHSPVVCPEVQLRTVFSDF